jgi:hypothetical protein
MERTRSTPKDVWNFGQWLQKQCGKVKKNYRSCIELKRPEKLQKLYGKDQKHSRSCIERTRSTPEGCFESDYRSSVVRSRRTTEAELKRPEDLQKLDGKEQKYSRRCMRSDIRSSVVRLRRTKEAVWEGPEALQKMYGKWLQKQCGKIQKNSRNCLEKTRRLQKTYGKWLQNQCGKIQKN